MKIFISLILLLSVTACTSKLLVATNPPDAEIKISVHGSNRTVEFGKSPIELTEDEIRKKVGVSLGKTNLVEVHIEKPGYRPEKILVTAGQWGSLSTRLNVKLYPAKEDVNYVDTLLQHVMNAQKFTQTRQYSRAHDEVDRALELNPKFARAMALKGTIYYLQEYYNESEQWYSKSIEEDPNMTDAIKMLDLIRKKKQ